MGTLVDAHVHVWEMASPEYPWHADLGVVAENPEPIDGLLASMAEAHVDAALVVQSSMYGYDHAYLEHALARNPRALRGIALADPLDPMSPGSIRALAANPAVVGLRMIPLRADRGWFEPGVASIWETAAELSLAVTFLAGPDQLPEVATWAGRFPEVQVVIDHLGRPDLAGRPGPEAVRGLVALAPLANCHVKVSGIGGMSKQPAPHQDTWPWVRATVDAFGAARVMWGSDFPWLKAYGGSLGASLESTRHALAECDAAEQGAIFGGNAGRLFRFESEPPSTAPGLP